MSGHTAGTAADGYRVVRLAHDFVAEPSDPGRRPFCRECGREQLHHREAQ